ncbi:MAG: hypothetical protein DDT25_00471 [Chloroflexi bacterium]|nr:hypothetical protein [Chloroflexota bacterium]
MTDVCIGPFEAFGTPVEVIALGRIRRGPGVSPEPEIEVLLADAEPTDGEWVRPYHIFVSCGQIDLLVGGTIWKEGKQEYTRAGAKRVTAQVTAIGQELITGAPGPVGMVQRRPALPVNRLVAGYLLSLNYVDPGDSSSVKLAWLPIGEVFRVLFGVSSSFLMDLVLGSIHHFRGSKPPLFDIRRSRFERDTGVCHLYASRALRQEEAFMCAMLVSDSRLATAARAPFRRLGRAPFDDALAGVPLDMSWPFAEPIEMTFEGNWVTTHTGYRRFVVTQILGMQLRPSFSKIVIHRSGASNTLDISQAGMPPATVTAAADLTLTTGTVPGTRSPTREVRTAAISLADFSAIAITEEVDRNGEAGQRSRFAGSDFAAAEGSTSDANAHGDADQAHTIIRRRQSPLRRTKEAPSDRLMDREKADALAKTHAAIVSAAGSLGMEVSIEKNPEGDDALVCLLIHPATGWQVVIADAGSTPANPRSLGALADLNGRPLRLEQKEQIYEILYNQDGKWRSPKAVLTGLRLEAMNRSSACWSDAAHYAQRLRDLLSRFMWQAPHG